MIVPTNPVGGVRRPLCRLQSGLDLLEQWSDGASQSERNVVYKALFAVLDGSVRGAYIVFDDVERPEEFVVLVKDDLVVRIHLHGVEAFGVTYIGSPGESSDHHLGRRRQKPSPRRGDPTAT
jgi:hypothetical protein